MDGDHHTFVFYAHFGFIEVHQSNRPSYRGIVSTSNSGIYLSHGSDINARLSLVLVVVGWYTLKGPSPERGQVVLLRFGKSTLSSFPVQVFAYTCSQNLFPIFNELKDRTQKKMNVVIGSSIGTAVGVYQVVSHNSAYKWDWR